jgi:hypothetical protein
MSTYGVHCILVPATISLEELVYKCLLCRSKCRWDKYTDDKVKENSSKRPKNWRALSVPSVESLAQ